MNFQLHTTYNKIPYFFNRNWDSPKIYSNPGRNKPWGDLFWTSSYNIKKNTSAWFELCRQENFHFYSGVNYIYGYIFKIVNSPKILEIKNQDDIKKLLSNKKYVKDGWCINYEKLFWDYDILWVKLRKYGEPKEQGVFNNINSYKKNPFINFMCESMVIKNPEKFLSLEKIQQLGIHW